MKKRVISLFLALLMLVGIVPASFATETASAEVTPTVVFDYNCDSLTDKLITTLKFSKYPTHFFADSKTAGVEPGTILVGSDGSTQNYCYLDFNFDLPNPAISLELDMRIDSLMSPTASPVFRGFTLELNIPGNRIVYIALNSLGEPDSDGKNADIYTFKAARASSSIIKSRIAIPTDGKFHKWEIQFNGESEIRVLIDGELQVAFENVTVNSEKTSASLRIQNLMNNLAYGTNNIVIDNIKLTSGITMNSLTASIDPASTAENFTVHSELEKLPANTEITFVVQSKDDPTKVYTHTYKPTDLVSSVTVTDIPFTGLCDITVSASGTEKHTFTCYLYEKIVPVNPGETLTDETPLIGYKYSSLHYAASANPDWKEKYFKYADDTIGGGIYIYAKEEISSFTVPVKLNGKFAVYVGYMPGTYQFTVNGRNVYVTDKKTTGNVLGERFAVAGDFKNEEITISNTKDSTARLAYVKFVPITDEMYEKYAVRNDAHNMIMDNDGFSILTGEGENTAEILINESVVPYAEPIDLRQYNFTMWVTGMLNFPSKTQKALIENRLRELGVPEEKWPVDNWTIVDKNGDVIDWSNSPMRDLDRRYVENIRNLNKEGIPHEILADYIAENNYGELYASLRMSAYYTETATGGQYFNGSIFQLYPEWIREGGVQLSYYYEGYRDYIFGVLMEMASSKNVTGIMVDFGRYPLIFGDECTDVNERTRIINEFVKRVHDNLPEGKKLCIRVSNPTATRSAPAGLDYKHWVKEGWVDRIIISDQGHETFFDVKQYTEFFKDYPEVEIYIGVNAQIGGHDRTKEEEAAGQMSEPHVYLTAEEFLLRAYDIYTGGADGIFLFSAVGSLFLNNGADPTYAYMNNKDETVKWYTFEYPAYSVSETIRFINPWEASDTFKTTGVQDTNVPGNETNTDNVTTDSSTTDNTTTDSDGTAPVTDPSVTPQPGSADMTPVFVGIGALAVVVLAIVVMILLKKKKK